MRNKPALKGYEYVWGIELPREGYKTLISDVLDRYAAGQWKYSLVTKYKSPGHEWYAGGKFPDAVSILATEEASPTVIIQVAAPANHLELTKQIIESLKQSGEVVTLEPDNL